MPTKVSKRDICRKVIDRNRDELVALRMNGKRFMAYDKARFRTDMRSKEFLSTTTVIDAKWDMLKADDVIQECGKLYAVDICILYAAASLPLPSPSADGRVIDRLIDRETDAEEGGQ
jgi:hypothetical protein